MNIIEFLFDNPFILVILIGILSGVFGRKKQEEQQRQKNTQRKNTGPVAQPFEFPWEDVFTEKEKPISTNNVEDYSIEEQDEYVQEWESDTGAERVSERESLVVREELMTSAVLQPIESTEPAHELPNDSQAFEGAVTRKDDQDTSSFPNKAINFKRINRKEVVQGIIWSQVLGEPRAKEPHRTRNFQYGQRRS